MKRILAGALGALLLSQNLLAAPLFERTGTDLAAEVHAAAAEGKALAVAFELRDCHFCAEMRRDIYGQAEVVDYYRQHYRTLTVTLDDDTPLTTPAGQSLAPAAWAAGLGIHGTPAFAFFDADGQLLTRYAGRFEQPEAFVRLGEYVRSGDYEQRPFHAAASRTANTAGHAHH